MDDWRPREEWWWWLPWLAIGLLYWQFPPRDALGVVLYGVGWAAFLLLAVSAHLRRPRRFWPE